MVQHMREGNDRRDNKRELEELYNEPNIVNVIKSNRQRWAGHVVRMDENKLPKKILWTTLDVNKNVTTEIKMD